MERREKGIGPHCPRVRPNNSNTVIMKTLNIIPAAAAVLLFVSCGKQAPGSSDADRLRLTQLEAKVKQLEAEKAALAKNNRPAASISRETPITGQVYSFDEGAFFQEYERNKPAFLRTFGGKLIRLRATVRTFADDGVLWMGEGSEQILCYFDPSELRKLDRLTQWQHATVIGSLSPEGQFSLRSCRLVDTR